MQSPRGISVTVGLLVVSILMTGQTLQAEELEVTPAVTEFLLIDTDRNDCIDPEEMRNAAVRLFDALDRNDDNMLSGDEHPSAVTATGAEILPPHVHLSRFQAEIRRSFGLADADGNGCLNRQEWGVG